jgi:glycosyltransferase involved in cell wall biosynthesis
MVLVNHYVGLSGIGGVQKNFIDYYIYTSTTESQYKHKVFTRGVVDEFYSFDVSSYNINKLGHFIRFLFALLSGSSITHIYNRFTSKWLACLLLLPVKNIIMHERGVVWNATGFDRIIIKLISKRVSLIITNSFATKTMLCKNFSISPSMIKVVHNGIVNKKYIHQKSNVNSDFTVGYLGRLDTNKGVNVLIDSIKYIPNKINCIIAGDGPLKDYLEKQGKHDNNVIFAGRVDPDAFLSSIDLLVVPSIREPLGNVCIEAGMHRIPVIASRVDGIPEIIEDEVSGLLITPSLPIQLKKIDLPKSVLPTPRYVVDPDTWELMTPKQIDPKILAKMITNLINNDALREECAINLNNRVNEHFSMDRYVCELNTIYDQFNLT